MKRTNLAAGRCRGPPVCDRHLRPLRQRRQHRVLAGASARHHRGVPRHQARRAGVHDWAGTPDAPRFAPLQRRLDALPYRGGVRRVVRSCWICGRGGEEDWAVVVPRRAAPRPHHGMLGHRGQAAGAPSRAGLGQVWAGGCVLLCASRAGGCAGNRTKLLAGLWGRPTRHAAGAPQPPAIPPRLPWSPRDPCPSAANVRCAVL